MVATRASDADRDSCLEDIEAAFADGRLDDAEREARTQAALQATTLGELADLVSDLGPAATLPRRPAATAAGPDGAASTVSRRALGVLLLVAGVLAVIALTILVVATSGDDDDATPGGRPQQAVPQDRVRLQTAAGFERFVDQTRAKFGTTLVDSAAIYRDYASVEVVVKDDPRRVERWYFGKGYEGDPSKGTRSADAVTVDLAAIDPAGYARALKRAPAVLGVEDITTTYVVMGETGGQPTYSVYVSNEYSESGYYTFTLQGEEVYRYAFE
jgi:hypothetical protein